MATSVLPSPVFISAMSPSWSTIAPISCTSKGRMSDGAPGSLAHGRVCLEDEVVELLAVLQPLPELGRLAGELLVGEALEVRLERRDVGGLLGESLEAAALAHAEEALERSVVLRHQREMSRVGIEVRVSVRAGRPLASSRRTFARPGRRTRRSARAPRLLELRRRRGRRPSRRQRPRSSDVHAAARRRARRRR